MHVYDSTIQSKYAFPRIQCQCTLHVLSKLKSAKSAELAHPFANNLQWDLVLPSEVEVGAHRCLNRLRLSGCLRDHHADRLDPGVYHEGAQISIVPGKGQFRNPGRSLMYERVQSDI